MSSTYIFACFRFLLLLPASITCLMLVNTRNVAGSLIHNSRLVIRASTPDSRRRKTQSSEDGVYEATLASTLEKQPPKAPQQTAVPWIQHSCELSVAIN